MQPLYDIPPALYNFDDPRIRMLESGAVTQAEFMRLVRPDDPFEINGGRLYIISKDDQIRKRQQFIDNMRKFILASAGIRGADIYENRDKFMEVYPELKPDIDAFTISLNGAVCVGCDLNNKTGHLVTKMLALPVADRKLEIIESIFDKYPTKKFTMMKLRGQPYTVEDSDITLPPNIMRRDIPILQDSDKTLKTGVEFIHNETDKYLLTEMDGCIACVRKHLSEALELAIEIAQGYKPSAGHFKHMDRLIGNLVAGESEAIKQYPELAMRIRLLRLKIMNQKDPTVNG